jgi:hypothetical protein
MKVSTAVEEGGRETLLEPETKSKVLVAVMRAKA